MHEAAHHLSSEAGWRVRALLRTKRSYDTKAMIRPFKCHLLSFLEGATPAIYHAAPGTLKPIDDIQDRFLEEMGMTCAEALLKHNLAPIKRSIFGLVGVFNRLPEDGVISENVKRFQRALQKMAKHAPQQGLPVWAQIFHPMV